MRNSYMLDLVASAHLNNLDVKIYMKGLIRQMVIGRAKPEELLRDVCEIHHPEAV